MCWDFSGGPIVKNPLGKAGDMGWISGWGTKIPPAVKQVGTSAATSEAAHLQPMRHDQSPRAETKDPPCHGWDLTRPNS